MREYDYIIVGAGSAGCVLAEKLSVDRSRQVLLVEEGLDDGGWLVRMPKGFGKTLTDPARTHYHPTVNRREGGAGQEIWLRGKLLGGSSAVNGMVWNPGAAADYDRLAELAGPQWSWAEMLPHLRGLENRPAGPDETGSDGPVEIRSHPAPTPLHRAWLAAGAQMGLPIKPDRAMSAEEGIGLLQWNIDRRGRRVSAARAFLDRARDRPNLTIATGVRTDRVILRDRRAIGIEGVADGQPVSFSARGEVILSAGALGSVRILELSGIGDPAVLAAAGVPVLVASPDIGQNMREHLLILQNFRLRDGALSQNRAYGGLNLVANVARHMLLGSGPMSYGSAEAAAFVRVLPDATRPDVQIMFQPYSLDPEAAMAFEQQPGMHLYSFKLRPSSQGSVHIASADPTAPLAIDPRYLEDEQDRRAVIGAVRYIRALMAQPALAPFVIGETEATATYRSDEDILELYRRRGQAGYHATATVRMGLDNSAPLDGRLRLRGVDGLRVVDLSVFPEMISGNTNAPTMALGSRAAALILEDARRAAVGPPADRSFQPATEYPA